MIDRLIRFASRLLRAIAYYRRLRYSWRLAWVKSGYTGIL